MDGRAVREPVTRLRCGLQPSTILSNSDDRVSDLRSEAAEPLCSRGDVTVDVRFHVGHLKNGEKSRGTFQGLMKKPSVLQQSDLEDVFKWTQLWMKLPATFDMKKMKINKTTSLLDIVLLTSLSTGLYWNSENGAKINTSEAKHWAF